MTGLPKHVTPEVKLDSAPGWLETALTAEQRRGLFDHPGTTVVAIVEFKSVSYTGHADGEDKKPQVKLRIGQAEVAGDNDEAAALLEAKRAMYRRRKINGTLDEVGPGPRDAEGVLDEAFAHYPGEEELRAHLDAEQRVGR